MRFWKTDLTWARDVEPAVRREQFAHVYDYIKFHIGLYLATPPVIVIIGEGLHVETCKPFIAGVVAMCFTYLCSGISAAWFMRKHVNTPRTNDFPSLADGKKIFGSFRRTMHHALYFVGLAFGIAGIVMSALYQHPCS